MNTDFYLVVTAQIYNTKWITKEAGIFNYASKNIAYVKSLTVGTNILSLEFKDPQKPKFAIVTNTRQITLKQGTILHLVKDSDTAKKQYQLRILDTSLTVNNIEWVPEANVKVWLSTPFFRDAQPFEVLAGEYSVI